MFDIICSAVELKVECLLFHLWIRREERWRNTREEESSSEEEEDEVRICSQPRIAHVFSMM